MSVDGTIIWLTGLSGAGKTTVGNEIAARLGHEGRRVEILDGDVVRENLSKGLGFSREDRDTNIRRIGFVARLLARNGVTAIVAAISPYREVRDEVRADAAGDGVRFVEVFCRCPLDVLVDRDVKGLYVKALRGEIANFTGISDPYEEPLDPDVVVDSSSETVTASASRVLEALAAPEAVLAARDA
jgi:adenylylsulfate kinase